MKKRRSHCSCCVFKFISSTAETTHKFLRESHWPARVEYVLNEYKIVGNKRTTEHQILRK
ncbi:hypothetical protein BACCAP_04699 [Pseudoflavonifractor capillosus ATCC 29799]|uniref:Uncharacterized protein n=1 Tax=Pseudoflavonifractor capillosus ATCC 29799 TaxID=411467 RepID=A6P2G8_9FIRM|nr:hypothetical protein BACCAP_04699 [Pseudoflavonifractor capillosus ATCC 29799]